MPQSRHYRGSRNHRTPRAPRPPSLTPGHLGRSVGGSLEPARGALWELWFLRQSLRSPSLRESPGTELRSRAGARARSTLGVVVPARQPHPAESARAHWRKIAVRSCRGNAGGASELNADLSPHLGVQPEVCSIQATAHPRNATVFILEFTQKGPFHRRRNGGRERTDDTIICGRSSTSVRPGTFHSRPRGLGVVCGSSQRHL